MTRKPVLRSTLYLLFAATLLFPQTITSAPHQDGLSGVWAGAMDIAGESIDIRVVLQATTDGGWTGLIDIPGENTSGFPLTEINVSGNSVSFAMAGYQGNPVFVGTWNLEDQTIAGTVERSGQTFRFNMTGASPARAASETTVERVSPANGTTVAGTWRGHISAGTQTLQIVFHLVADVGGALTATMDSPDQGQLGLPVTRTAFDGSVLRLELDYAGASFEGTMAVDGSSIDGTWSQGGASLPLRVTKQPSRQT